ncbi:hypothetical protein AGIG_G17020 [Arapaima gigas]
MQGPSLSSTMEFVRTKKRASPTLPLTGGRGGGTPETCQVSTEAFSDGWKLLSIPSRCWQVPDRRSALSSSRRATAWPCLPDPHSPASATQPLGVHRALQHNLSIQVPPSPWGMERKKHPGTLAACTDSKGLEKGSHMSSWEEAKTGDQSQAAKFSP